MKHMKRVLLIILVNLLLLMVHRPVVHAQVVCGSAAGEFGPTCAATIEPPTNTPINTPIVRTNPTLPPANTPIPELPKSGNGAVTASLIFGGGIIFLLGIGTLSIKNFKTGF